MHVGVANTFLESGSCPLTKNQILTQVSGVAIYHIVADAFSHLCGSVNKRCTSYADMHTAPTLHYPPHHPTQSAYFQHITLIVVFPTKSTWCIFMYCFLIVFFILYAHSRKFVYYIFLECLSVRTNMCIYVHVKYVQIYK